jgi:hypothetical protein
VVYLIRTILLPAALCGGELNLAARQVYRAKELKTGYAGFKPSPKPQPQRRCRWPGRGANGKEKTMDVILLQGPGSKGKTSTLGLLYALLVTVPATTILGGPTPVGRIKGDFDALLDYTGKKGRRKIAIWSAGDTIGTIKSAVAKYAATADVLVIAHSITAFRTPITAIIPPPHVITNRVPKTVSALPGKPLTTGFILDCLVKNTKDAQTIQALL